MLFYSDNLISIATNLSEIQKIIQQRQQLDSQLTENQIVKEELNLLNADSNVYKSVGPILLKVDLVEAKTNVATRMDMINKELKKVDDRIGTLEKKQDGHRETITKLQNQLQQAQVKAAMSM